MLVCQPVSMNDDRDWATATRTLRLATELVDGIQEGLGRRGFADVRPAHGFAFVFVSQGHATIASLASHLGVTKQAAAQLVGQLVAMGYIDRTANPHDRRSQLLTLSSRGVACTRAAREAAEDTVSGWKGRLPAEEFACLVSALHTVTTPGPLRPSW